MQVKFINDMRYIFISDRFVTRYADVEDDNQPIVINFNKTIKYTSDVYQKVFMTFLSGIDYLAVDKKIIANDQLADIAITTEC